VHELSQQQQVQEGRYEYPYHYIPLWDGKRFAHFQARRHGHVYLSYLFFVLDKATALGFESLLDVGCGDGRFLYELDKRVPGKTLVGVDYSERAIAFARVMSERVTWVCGDVRDRALFGSRFDLVTLIETLEHIPPGDVPGFVEGIHQHLKGTGSLIVTVPSTNVRVYSKHYQHFDAASLAAALRPFFEPAETFFLNRKASPTLKLINHLLYNHFFILNHRGLLTGLYRYYTRNFLITDSARCARVAGVFRPAA
jgi:2-polyprenyl-3-methyl-5-hydroxy-6-metoxy-1,4-benzoquinol methylase